MQEKSNRKRWIALAAAAAVLVVGGAVGVAVASGAFDGGSSSAQTPGPSSSPSESAAPAVPVKFTAEPADQSVEVNPITVPALKVEHGTIDSVSLAPLGGGAEVSGDLAGGKTEWTASEPLKFDTEYTFEFTLADANGKTTTSSQTFHTVTAPHEANAFMGPLDKSVVGVGHPIEINFSEPVTNKTAVEEAITITSSSGQAGAFYWITDNKVRYRPETFWEPNSTVTVDMALFGVDFGNSMIGNFNETRTFSVHNSRVAVVDNATKTMQVFIDGQLTRTFPVTLGDEQWPSPSGYQVVMSQHATLPFRAESIGLKPGDPDYYEPFDASWASRLTNSGVFVHQALPGALGALGVINVSHGCVGMSPEGAKYFYDTFEPGDLVQVLNTGIGPAAVWDGYGDWNVPWTEYSTQPKA
ncbi:L,D-transpeptidase [Arthrobacter luteolus]|uniref:L,D-transpeptidase n=1 Tax=Arthrobacter luteolus TaxID=98672 RepID=UPI00082951A9|nr:Ig-like domain-containing protein [Arthrobacter luteolus]